MSQPDLTEESKPVIEETPVLEETAAPAPADIPTQKQKTNVYTVMLIISFICLVTASVLLWRELNMWGDYPWWNTSEGIPDTTSYILPSPAGEAAERMLA